MTSMGLSGSIDLEVDWCRFCLVGGRTGGAIEVCRGRSALGGPAAGAQRIQFQRMGLWRWKDQRNATCCWEGATLIIAGLDPVVRITPHLWAIRRPFGKGPTKPGLGDETDHHSYQPVNTRDDPPSTQFMYNIYIYPTIVQSIVKLQGWNAQIRKLWTSVNRNNRAVAVAVFEMGYTFSVANILVFPRVGKIIRYDFLFDFRQPFKIHRNQDFHCEPACLGPKWHRTLRNSRTCQPFRDPVCVAPTGWCSLPRCAVVRSLVEPL